MFGFVNVKITHSWKNGIALTQIDNRVRNSIFIFYWDLSRIYSSYYVLLWNNYDSDVLMDSHISQHNSGALYVINPEIGWGPSLKYFRISAGY